MRVHRPWSRRYCASTAEACADEAVVGDRRRRAEPRADRSAWREPRSENLIKFGPLPLIDMDYAKRRSGVQQVISFDGHR